MAACKEHGKNGLFGRSRRQESRPPFKPNSVGPSAFKNLMAAQITLHSDYLPADAVKLLGALSVQHPALASVVVLLSFGAAVAILRRRFGRGGGDIFAIALFVVVVTL